MHNFICKLFSIQLPIIQVGYVCDSSWQLASAVSNVGGLGTIGAGSRYPDVFQSYVRKCKEFTNKPFGVKIRLWCFDIELLLGFLRDVEVKFVFSSAGNPKTWRPRLKRMSCAVALVIARQKFVEKAEQTGVGAIAAGVSVAGGHNGRKEVTTFRLFPAVRQIATLLIFAAGVIFCGFSMVWAVGLGADGIQSRTLLAVRKQVSGGDDYKKIVIVYEEGDQKMALKQMHLVRLLKRPFPLEVTKAEIIPDELEKLPGRGRTKKGVFEGNIEKGAFDFGQVTAYLFEIKPVITS